MNDVNTILYACAKTVESKFGVKPKKKRKPDKNKKPKWNINIEKEIETMRGEMSILKYRSKNKKSQERYKKVQNHKCPSYSKYQRGAQKAKNTSKNTKGKTI